MKIQFTIIFLVLVLVVGCGKSSDPNPASSSSSSATASINGKAFTATDTKVTDTGNGLAIKMASATETINVLTDANKAGAYTIINTGGRLKAGTSASASYAVGSDIYLSVSGTVTVTVDASGKVSCTYSITFKNSTGTVIAITDGKLSSTTVTAFQVPAGKCLIASVAKTETDTYGTYNDIVTLIFDSDGHLLRENHNNGAFELYVWAGGVVTNHLEFSPNGALDERQNWFYTNGKLTKVEVFNGSTGSKDWTYQYTLNAAGQPTSVLYTPAFGTAYTDTYTYDVNGNCTSATFGSSLSTEAYSNYDSKPNLYYQLLPSYLGITFDPDTESGMNYSKNNAGRVVATVLGASTTITYTYTYNSKGNVETISTISSANGLWSSKQTFSYVGCN